VPYALPHKMTLGDFEGRYALLWLNSARYGLGCTTIGSGILAFKLYKNHRPWITFKVTDNQYGRLS